MAVTISDIAKVSGYSISTVAKALNDENVIKEETRRKIKKVAEELGYVPNQLAKNLVKRKTNTIGLIVTDIKNPYFSELTFSILKRANELGFKVLLAVSNEDNNMEKGYLRTFIETCVDGLLIVPTYKKNADRMHLWDLRKRKIPFVLNRKILGLDASYVSIDFKKGYYDLTRYLIDMGHKKIAFVGPTAIPGVLEGYKAALQNYGITVSDKLIIETGTGYEDVKMVMENVSQIGDRPTAILAGNDIIALSLMMESAKHGITIPDDISLVSFDDVKFAEIAHVPLTTMAQPIDELGNKSVDLLIDLIRKKSSETKELILPTKLIERSSCKKIN